MAEIFHQIILESSSGTITGCSDHSTTTLTSQDIKNVGPVLSLLVDPTVSLTDLKEKSEFKRKKAASSEDILTSHKQTYLRKYSSMDALNDSYRPPSVVESAMDLWEGIIQYLKTHLHAGRRRPSWTIRSYHDCFFGSEMSGTIASYMRETLREDAPILSDIKTICSKLIASGVIKCLREGHSYFNEAYLYQFSSSLNKTNEGHTTTLSPHQKRCSLRPVGRETLKLMSNAWQTCRKHLLFQRERSRSLTSSRTSSPATRSNHQERVTTGQKWHQSSRKPPIQNTRQQVHFEYRNHYEFRDRGYSYSVYKSSSFTTLTSYSAECTHTGNNSRDNNNGQWIVYGFV